MANASPETLTNSKPKTINVKPTQKYALRTGNAPGFNFVGASNV